MSAHNFHIGGGRGRAAKEKEEVRGGKQSEKKERVRGGLHPGRGRFFDF